MYKNQKDLIDLMIYNFDNNYNISNACKEGNIDTIILLIALGANKQKIFKYSCYVNIFVYNKSTVGVPRRYVNHYVVDFHKSPRSYRLYDKPLLPKKLFC